MSKREEYLAETLAARREYEAASSDIWEMIRSGMSSGAHWDAAVGRQADALDIWQSLPRKYAEFRHDEDSYSG